MEDATGSPHFDLHLRVVRDGPQFTKQLRVILVFEFLFHNKAALSRDDTAFPAREGV